MNTDLMFSSEGDWWRTPTAFLDWLRPRFEFTLDSAASDSVVTPRFINAEQDALKTPWDGRVFCNPPYSIGDQFVARGLSEARHNPKCEGVCLLVPSRTDTAWFQDAYPGWNRVEFLRGRLKFWVTPEELALMNAIRAEKAAKAGKKFTPLSPENTAPFPSVLLIAGFGLTGHVAACVDWRGASRKRSAA